MAGMASPAIAIEMAVGGFRGFPRRPDRENARRFKGLAGRPFHLGQKR